MKLGHFLEATLLATLVSADKWTRYTDDYYAAIGCKLAVDKSADFCGTPELAKKYKCICKNKYAMASWAYCASAFPEVDQSGFNEQIVEMCQENANQTWTSDQIKANLVKYNSTIVNIESDFSFNKTSPQFAVTGKKLKKLAYTNFISYKHRWDNVNNSHYMGIAFVSAVGAVTLLAGLINWSLRLSRRYSNAVVGRVPNFFRKYFTLGLIGNHLHVNKLQGINPDRIEAFFIFIMFLYSILCCTIIGFNYYPGDTVFATYQAGTSRYYGDRACIILSYQMPLLFIFPGRNNFFQYITRWKYSRFVTFHKWLGRIIMMEIFIHAFAMASQTYALDKFTRFGTDWYREGITACVCAAIIIVLAAGPIRRFYYELFLAVHVVLVVMFLWTAWRHAYSQDYQDFYWACCAVWIFDTVVRFVRIVLFGGPKTAEIELFPGEDVLKITVPASKILKGTPGSHAFIHFLTPLRFWQSHPFTVYPSETQDSAVTFTCRVKKGMTKFLADKCKSSGNNKISMKICVDGYYGEQSPYHFYDKTVFITGGTGIAGPYFHAKKLVQSDSNREVKLYWSVRTYECIRWFVPELLTFKDTQLKPVIFVSQPENNSSSTSSDDNEKKESDVDSVEKDDILKQLDFVEIKHGRLSVAEIVNSEISSSTGSVAFGACAHTQVVDDVRRTVANSLDLSTHKIEYFEEMQSW